MKIEDIKSYQENITSILSHYQSQESKQSIMNQSPSYGKPKFFTTIEHQQSVQLPALPRLNKQSYRSISINSHSINSPNSPKSPMNIRAHSIISDKFYKNASRKVSVGQSPPHLTDQSEWINDLIKDSQKFYSNPARSINKVKVNSQKQSLMFNNRVNSNINTVPHIPDEETKIIKYDFHEEKVPPEVLVQQCKKSKGPHAFSPLYQNGSYDWQPVRVIDYNQQTEKFTIVFSNKISKQVNRLSLMFNDENQEDFKQRQENAQKRQLSNFEETRFQQYIDQINDNQVRELPLTTIERIKQKAPGDTHLVSQLINQVQKNFLNSQKRSHVLHLMSDPDNNNIWQQLRIKNNYIYDKNYKYYGTIVTHFKESFDKIKEVSLLSQTQVVKVLQQFENNVQKLSKFQFFNLDFNSSLNLHDFTVQQLSFNFKQFNKFESYYYDFVDEIQQRLKNNNDFTQNDMESYIQSYLKRIISLLDLKYLDFIRSLIQKSLSDFCIFLSSFCLNAQNSNKIMRHFPLITLNLNIFIKKKLNLKKSNIFFKAKGEQKSLLFFKSPLQNLLPQSFSFEDILKSFTEQQQFTETCVYIEPSLKQILSAFLYLLQTLVKQVGKIQPLEVRLLPYLYFETRKPLPEEKVELDYIKTIIQDQISQYFISPQQFLSEFDRYKYLIEQNPTKVINTLFGDNNNILNHDIMEIKQRLDQYKTDKISIQKLCVIPLKYQMFQLDVSQVQEFFVSKAQDLITSILSKISSICHENTITLAQTYDDLTESYQIFPSDEYILANLKNQLQENHMTLQLLRHKLNRVGQFITLFEEFQFEYQSQLKRIYWELYSRPIELYEIVLVAKQWCIHQEDIFLNNLDQQKTNFVQNLRTYNKEFVTIQQFNLDSQEQLKNNAIFAQILQEKIELLVAQQKDFNQRESVFKQVLSYHEDLDVLVNSFKPYYNLWQNALEFDQDVFDWTSSPLIKLQFTQIDNKVQQTYKKMESLQVIFEEIKNPDALDVIYKIKKDIQNFQSTLWVFQLLTTEAMSNLKKSQIHWKEIFQKAGIMLELNNQITFNMLIGHIQSHRCTVQEVSVKAGNQLIIEKKLKEIEETAKKKILTSSNYKEKYVVLQGFDEILTAFDDFLTTIMYLKNLCRDSSSKNSWKKIKQGIIENKLYTTRKQIAHLEYRLILIQDTLEEVYKCQKNWLCLEYFFSYDINLPKEQRLFDKIINFWNDSVNNIQEVWVNIDNERIKLEFLGCNKQLESIKKSLSSFLNEKRQKFPRFFFLSDQELTHLISEGQVQKLINKCFSGIESLAFVNGSISAIISQHQEIVPLINPIAPGETQLMEVQQMMIHTLKKSTSVCLGIEQYLQLENQPGQIIQLANMLQWTYLTENSIQSHSLPQFLSQLDKQLFKLIFMIKMDLQQKTLITLGSLVVQTAHNKSVIQQLIRDQVGSIQDFIWVKNIRHYQDNDGVKVKIINGQSNYGFEYLGNTTRLVITPLIDRCHQALMSARFMSQGGALQGSTGTGKTEMVKDLANSLGYQCVVMNCSPHTPHQSITKLLKGVISSGMCFCLDDFDRLDYQVMSQIQQAIKEIKSVLFVDDDEVQLIDSYFINITLAESSLQELPCGLKGLFRPVVMITVDRILILEGLLMSSGFQNAQIMAKKIINVLNLCEHQLPCEFYVGLRTIKDIFLSSCNLRKSMPLLSEEQISVSAIQKVITSRLKQLDILILQSIIQSIFPDTPPQELVPNHQKQKCLQLIKTLQNKQGVVVLGRSMSGKSTIIEMTRLYMNDIQFQNINSKSISPDHFRAVLGKLIQYAQPQQKHMIIFDSPLDPVWFDNLNALLDGSKQLTLFNGETIKIPDSTSYIFETDDIQFATPRNISRCGLVYIEEGLAWDILIDSLTFDYNLKNHTILIQKTLKQLINVSLCWALKNSALQVNQMEMNYTQSCLKFWKIFSSEIQSMDIPEDQIKQTILYSVAWGIGGPMIEKTRKLFSDFLLHIVKSETDLVEIYYNQGLKSSYDLSIKYENGNIFEWAWGEDGAGRGPGGDEPQHIGLMSMFRTQISRNKLAFGQCVFVPTQKTLRTSHFLNLSIQNKMHFIICGESGCGKSTLIKSVLNNYQNSDYSYIIKSFTGHTKPNQVQKMIEMRINSRRRKACYGPEEGKKNIIIFIDDLNLPNPDPYGAQPAIELLRQWMVGGGFYDLETGEFKQIQDILFVSAMGSFNPPTNRYLRYSILFYADQYEITVLKTICNGIMMPDSQDIPSDKLQIIKKTLDLFNRLKKKFLPIPSKPHYTFNLRDISKVIQNVSLSNNIAQQWIYECEKVFKDRLFEEDRNIYNWIISSFIQDDTPPLFYCPFNQTYVEELSQNLYHSHLTEFNQKYQMNILLFNDFIDHLSRITRVLSQEQGHVLLLGLGGNGRYSLAMLSTYIIYGTIAIYIENWTKDLQNLLRNIAIDEKQTVLLVPEVCQNDTQLDDICGILKQGEVGGLFSNEEKLKFFQDFEFDGPNSNLHDKYQHFVEICKKYIHVVIISSPKNFRRKLRLFPSLLKCTYMDYFLSPSTESMNNVAQIYLNDNFQNQDLKSNVAQALVEIYEDFLQQTSRYTPSSFYIELLQNFIIIQNKITAQYNQKIQLYETCINNMHILQQNIQQSEIEQEKPLHLLDIQKQENTSRVLYLQELQNQSVILKKLCEKEDKDCQLQMDCIYLLKDEYQKELNLLEIQLQNQVQNIKLFDDLGSLKSHPQSPILSECLCYIFQEEKSVKSKDFQTYANKKIFNLNLLQKIKGINLETIQKISTKNLEKTNKLFQNPIISKDSETLAGSIILWIHCILDVSSTIKILQPKRINLLESQQKLESCVISLNQKKQELQKIFDSLQDLKKNIEEQNTIEMKLQKSKNFTLRAKNLIKALDWDAWRHGLEKYTQQLDCSIGDALISSGYVTLLGPFPDHQRYQAFGQWKKILQNLQIQFTDKYNLQNTLSDKITIRTWVNNKLPDDPYIIENVIIMFNSQRWPLVIDPQGQAASWIKKMEKGRNLVVLENYKTQNERKQCVNFDCPVLVENFSENQIFDSFLRKKPQKKENFFVYFVTKNPQISDQLNVLNFSVSQRGLEGYMTDIVIQMEDPIKYKQKLTNLDDYYCTKQKKIDKENLMLKILNKEGQALIENEGLVETLQNSQIELQGIEDAIIKQKNYQNMYEGYRKTYQPLSHLISSLFFVVQDLLYINKFYQWDLQDHVRILIKVVELNQKDKKINVFEKFKEILYDKICTQIFEKDKPIFSFLICQKILELNSIITYSDIQFLATNNTVEEMEQLEVFQGFYKDFNVNREQWRQFSQHEEAYYQQFPGKWGDIHYYFKLIIIKILIPQQFSKAIMLLVQMELGSYFIQTPIIDIKPPLMESNSLTPIIFLITPGSDPREEIILQALKQNIDLIQIPLTPGQQTAIEKQIIKCQSEGKWVLIQNIDLFPFFMPLLEKIMEEKEIHQSFRLFLVTQGCDIPVSILLRSVRIAYESPIGLKNRILKYSQGEGEGLKLQSQEYKKLFFGFVFFHSIVCERNRMLGLPYEFSHLDFIASWENLNGVMGVKDLPFDQVFYNIVDVTYGGRITEQLTKLILQDLTPLLQANLNLSSGDIGDLGQQYCNSYSFDTKYISEQIQKPHMTAQTLEGGIKQKCKQILTKMPECFDLEPVQQHLKIELFKYNQLIQIIKSSLSHLSQSMDGHVQMSQSSEIIYQSLIDNKIPSSWMKVSYPSMKLLSSYILDLEQRIKFMQGWVQQGTLKDFWISCFFYPKLFLNQILLNYANQNQIQVENLQLQVLQNAQDGGSYIHGLFLERAFWDEQSQCISIVKNKGLQQIPRVWLQPVISQTSRNLYSCPIYQTFKIGNRIDDNFIIEILLPVLQEEDKSMCFKLDVNGITQSND